MKKAYLSLLLILVFGCGDDLQKENIVPENLLGIWVPFEIVNGEDVLTGPFTANSIFGAYAESLKLDDAKKYYPVIWTSDSQFHIKSEDIGNYEFIESENKLLLTSGPWDMEFTIQKITQNELWISDEHSLYKLKRELTAY